jgi:hypothetical protein
MALYFRHDRRFSSERERISHYLERIPVGERLEAGKFYKRLAIPHPALAATVAEFPDLCAPDAAGLVSAEVMYNTVVCWYYRQVKEREPEEIRRLIADQAVRPSP